MPVNLVIGPKKNTIKGSNSASTLYIPQTLQYHSVLLYFRFDYQLK